MSLELKDFRCKLTLEGWAAVSAAAKASGKDRTEIVRDVIHEWATKRIEEATLLNAHLVSEGVPGIGRDTKGQK